MEFVSQDEGGRQDATIKVKWERLRSYAEYFDRLRTAQVLQEAFWDSEKISASVKELFDARATVLAAMHVLINLEFRENSSNEESDFYHELMRDMGAVHSKNDTLRSKIDEAVETLKGELLPVIRMDRKVK